jgi:hypothetical protein
VVIWTVKATAGESRFEPSEDRFMPDVHAQHDLWLASISSERALADEQSDQKTAVEVR